VASLVVPVVIIIIVIIVITVRAVHIKGTGIRDIGGIRNNMSCQEPRWSGGYD
tara:strand:- start:1 stop:159 length:159 start_codon:yes stop_codon:yes gene_type:complete